MRSIIFRLLMLSFLAFSSFDLTAQSSPYGYAQAVDSLLQSVDKTAITSGLLYDRAFPQARLDLFNQIGSVDTTSPDHFEQAYYELFQAAYNNAPFPINIDSLDKKIELYNYQNILPVGIIDCFIQKIDPDAYTNGWVNINNDIVTNISGQPTNIYLTRHPQIISPLLRFFKPGTYQVILQPWMVFSNSGLTVSSISISVNGGGSTSIAMNGSANINLPGGDNYLDLTVYFTNATSFTNKCLLSLETSSQGLRTTGNDVLPCIDPVWIPATIPYQGYNESRPILGKNLVSFYFADCNNPVLRKPVIILDGLDPVDERNGTVIYNEWFNYIKEDGSKKNVAEILRSQGYDIIIVDMPHYSEDACPSCPIIQGGADYIQRNAMVLIGIIDELNRQLAANNSSEQIVIIGPSMGGQISSTLLLIWKNIICHTVAGYGYLLIHHIWVQTCQSEFSIL